MLVFSRWIEPAHDVTIESSGLPLQLGWPGRREVLISAELQQLKSPGIVRTFYFYSSEKRLAADAPVARLNANFLACAELYLHSSAKPPIGAQSLA
jgi:hypothetical protein